ncbi:AZOBR_p60025 family cell surface glycopolymer formation protein [Leptospira jelokensis]|uniref:Glycosyltransferase RgtA/B/C/D-like domain-containing protein n=1 Tax=Leptospira jelokensis TaxID=2484931 RepID=A0A4Z1A490_9LEPT|nr:hypothetical protein [Leptospira jelokensis]TGL62526.1 hypothetical protein EHQ62_14500 [Leptospira jelokensis]
MKPRDLWIVLILFILGVVGLIYAKTEPYGNSLSALIGIWEGFYEINPNLVDPQFVIYSSGGYDGQFFYLLAKDLFADEKWDLIVDSFYFRYHRIGLSFASGTLSLLFGSANYPILTLILLFSVFILSVYCLYELLPKNSKWLVLFYIVSPYSLNANLLLVADSFFVSLALIAYYFYSKEKHFLAFLFFFFTVFTRELGILFLAPIGLQFLLKKNWKLLLLYSIPGILFIVFIIYGWVATPNHLGTNPLGFRDMTDYPLFGFAKSFIENGSFHFKIKEFPKLLFLFSFFVVCYLCFSSLRQPSLQKLEILLPILGSLLVIAIAEEGYWRSFDNLSRMFTLILPFSILLIEDKKNIGLKLFLTSSALLFFFLLIRILFITPKKEYFLAI